MKWEEEFDKKFLMDINAPKEIAYKGGYHAVKAFIQSLLSQQKQEIVAMIKAIQTKELKDDPDSIMPCAHIGTLGEKYGDKIDDIINSLEE